MDYEKIYLFTYFGFLSKIFLIFWKGSSTSTVSSTLATTSTTISGTSTCNNKSNDATGRS